MRLLYSALVSILFKMVTDFQQKVYSLCKKVPKGRVTTYKEIGKAIGKKGQVYRAVGVALNKNPFSAWERMGGLSCRRQDCFVPCHRVVKSDGTVGGFASGSEKKIRLLRKEGIEIKKNKIVDFRKRLFRFR